MSEATITKNAIAKALKGLCREKPFDRISVADITSSCGLNRQTFYYHFQDKYELLSWIYYEENFSRIVDGITLENWDEKILQMLHIMLEDKAFYCNTVKEKEQTFAGYLFEMTKALFVDAIGRLDSMSRILASDREFDAKFYAYGICGLVLDWTGGGMKVRPEVLVAQLRELALNSEKAAILLEMKHGDGQ